MNMKTMYILPAVMLVIMAACGPSAENAIVKAAFGIHEVLQRSEMPESFPDTIDKLNVMPEADTLNPYIGYITEKDTLVLQTNFQGENFKLARTFYTVDDNKQYYAIAAIKPDAFIDGKDIQNTVPSGNNVEIRFTIEGARKWAEMTARNTGKSLAFLIDGEIYTMPLVNAEIRSGVALINALESEALASEISAKLNGK